MASHDAARITVLGLGLMGQALAATTAKAGHSTTVWNRTPGKAGEPVSHGATEAASLAEAIEASPLIVACLLDHDSVHAALDAQVESLSGRTLINLTSTSANQARELAAWAAKHGIAYLDGGIMATPDMIGNAGSSILYSGTEAVHTEYKELLELWGEAAYFGEDAGLASLWDFALLSGMYMMFAGFYHGAAMLKSAGVSAADFAQRAVPWVTALAPSISQQAATIDSGVYTTDVQHLDFTKAAVDAIFQSGVDQGINTELFAPIKAVIDRQVAAGHGPEAFERIFESIKNSAQ
ncbi:MAG: NAD(P)-dependent oxidoreductase [Stackebrandtia sp.]